MEHREDEQKTWVCLEEEDIPQTQQTEKKIDKPKPEKPPRKHKRKHKKTKGFKLRMTAGILAGLAGLYCLLVFSHISFIERWRTIYIETAMGTMTHQWLATAFLPQSVIDDVMNGRATVLLEQQDYNSTWDKTVTANQAAIGTWDEIKPKFEQLYSEIDGTSFWKYMASHTRDEVVDDDGYLCIDEADYDAEETGIKTTYGDDVCAIDTRNGIVIVSLTGEGYQGRLAIIKDPAMVSVAAASDYGKKGSYLYEICEENDAVLGINASGFDDPEGSGNGGDSYGIIRASGVMVHDVMDMNMKVISLSSSNQLNISNTLPDDARDAVQFSPALVINGKQLISGSSGWGLQPRSVIGQSRDGQMLMAIVDGRQPGYSIGITLGDLTDILYQYGAFQACNLDGGSSAIMYYNGREITHSSAATPKKGRHIPDAWIVKKAE